MREIKTISLKCETSETVKLSEIIDLQGNLKHREKVDYEKIKTSILKFGFSFPIFYTLLDGKKFCLDGHGRVSTLKKMEKEGYLIPELPAVKVECADMEEPKQKLLRLNSQYGSLSKESVLEFCSDMEINFEELALPDTTLDFSNVSEETAAETEGDDDTPEVDEKSEPVSKRGEMYELGNSILMCGDSTDAEDVARLMGGGKADMVFTDPPYNVAIGDKNKAINDNRAERGLSRTNAIESNIENDNFKTDEECGEKLWKPAFTNLFENAKDSCPIYVTMPQGGTHMMMMMMMMRDSGWQVKHELIWVKNSPTFSMGRLNYDYQHEPILYGWKKTHKWVGKGKFNKSIWEIDKPKKCDLHPTMKPIELIENALLNSSEKNDLILDLFGGSGSTLIACEKNNRKARLMELDPHYCDVIRKRYTKWAKENGKPITSGCLDDEE